MMEEIEEIQWDVRLEGRAWGSEGLSRYFMVPEKTEMVDGKLFWSDEERLTMLALLLENVGARETVRIGSADVWRAAVAELPDS